MHGTHVNKLCDLQVTLGITTLLTCVPAELGSAHQAGALALMTVAVSLLHAARAPAVVPAVWATPAAAAAVLAVGGAAIHFA
jgi:heme A synthase